VGAQFAQDDFIFGIDPGFRGGIAVLDRSLKLLAWTRTPLRTISDREEIDPKPVVKFAMPFVLQGKCAVAIEAVSAMPKQGVTGVFRFGFGTGLLTGVFETLQCQVIRIPPSTWKAAMGLNREKSESIQLARRLFGENMSGVGPKDDGVCEAALIAYFAATRIFGLSKNS